jgi:hypothetical protein
MENFENQNECQHSYECRRVCNLSTIKLSVPTHSVYLTCCYCFLDSVKLQYNTHKPLSEETSIAICINCKSL